jgi:DNA-binding CsgD family transcriptional regulator
MAQLDLLDSRVQLTLIGLLLAIVLGGIVDLVLDQPATLLSFHVIFELGFVLLCLGTAVFLWVAGSHSQRSLKTTQQSLKTREAELQAWRGRAQRLLQGLGVEIDRQMRQWGLSHAEREVSLFLLKGYSTKEIATHLGKSERTVRQQCGAVYKKSGLAGRADLSAFFLEDLLLPVSEEKRAESL